MPSYDWTPNPDPSVMGRSKQSSKASFTFKKYGPNNLNVPSPLGAPPQSPSALGIPTAYIKSSLYNIACGSTNTSNQSTLKPTAPLFKPAKPKLIKLEDIKEEDEDEEDVDDEIKIKSRKECMETLKNDLIAEEIEDEWVEIADLDSTVYPATLWCLNVKSFHAAPECSVEKLKQSMASAINDNHK